MADFESAISKTLIHEGGATLVDDAKDKGGLTRFGISQRSYPRVDISKLTLSQAKEIYKQDYWEKIQGDMIEDQLVAEAIFDTAVNMGPYTSSRMTQIALGMDIVDGIIGKYTLRHLQAADPSLFLAQLALAKISRYADICERDKEQKHFLLGWINRTLASISLTL